ncbi:MAG: lipopolysaccharide biosynthesis protein [Oscillospiraceae bacterium]|nr:lipopolysaccharide biosynthesis protein [Oscillospiraceae bacterium]
MTENDQKYLNITLKNDEKHDDDEVVISIAAIVRKLKKYFLVWFLVAIVIGGTLLGASIAMTTTSVTPVKALVSFSYDGIEKGKNPDGTDFRPETLKNPSVVEKALAECGLDRTLLETVRQDIVIEGIYPDDVIDRLTGYHSIFEQATSSASALTAAREIMDTTWTSTQYRVSFKYKEAGLNRSDAVQLINAILEHYKEYFYSKYGVNNALGVSLGATGYEDYDYAEAVDVFSTTLTSLNRYVNTLASDDSTQFRSSVTGYTFADLSAAIKNVQNLDLAIISSYLTVNNITKDKERVAAYYNNRIDELKRQQTVYEKQLATIEDAIANYTKDQVFVFGDGGNINTQSSIASDQYDKMIRQRINVTSDLASAIERVNYYEDRLEALRKPVIGSQDKVEKIESDLKKVNDKTKELITLVEDTAKDYYENVSLADAYSILVPANSSTISSISTGVKNVKYPLVGIEVVAMMIYLGVAFIQAIVEETKKRKEALAAAKAAADQEGEGTDADAEKKESASKKNK